MAFRDTFSLASRTVRGNKLRTGITVAIIAFGIMALVGISTAIEAIEQKFIESFSSMGANGFTIRFREPRFGFGGDQLKKEKKGKRKEKKSNMGKPITRIQAETFKQSFEFPARVCLNLFGARNAVVSFETKKSNPTVYVQGSDENYIDQNGFTLAFGRNLTDQDVESGRNVCIIGKDIAAKFFGENLELPVDKIIMINSVPFRVVGTLKPMGSTLGRSRDNMVLTSYNTVRRFFNSNPNASFNIQVKVDDVKMLEGAIGQATGVFRPIRKLTITEEDNFAIDKSDSFVELLLK
ncbi:MAG: ABC transporter permease, partial [Chitinophagaceae bacterium]|nr:ABC transporter permease [Chitinophagaceae bacterium]